MAHDIGNATPLSEFRRIAELSTARSLALLLGIAHALDDAVSQGKPPYEVTPDSVFLDPRLGAMVGDLGVAREALGNPARRPARTLGRARGAARRGRPPALRRLLVRRDRLHAADRQRAPQRRPRRTIAAAPPPRLSDARPDLPATLDTVFAVSMAQDPRKRYATAAEARHLLNLIIYGAPSVPVLEAQPRFRRGSQATKPAPTKHAPRLQTAVEEHPKRGPALVALLCGGALLAGALAGIVAGGGDDAPAPHPRVDAAGMSVELPDGWQQRPAEAGRLEAVATRDADATLTVVSSKSRVSEADQGTPVVLGDYEAWGHEPSKTEDGGRSAGFVIPTGLGQGRDHLRRRARLGDQRARALRADRLDAAAGRRRRPCRSTP